MTPESDEERFIPVLNDAFAKAYRELPTKGRTEIKKRFVNEFEGKASGTSFARLVGQNKSYPITPLEQEKLEALISEYYRHYTNKNITEIEVSE